MKRHIFDGQTRVARDALDPTEVAPWTPPGIGKEGNLVYAEPREAVSRPPAESDPSGPLPRVETAADLSNPGHSTAAAGHQEGLERGLEEGRRQGLEEGHQEGFRAGYEEGVAAGRSEGLQQGSEQAARQLQTMDSLLTHLTHALNEQDYQLEQALFNLVKEISRQVVQRELLTDSGHIMQVVQQALDTLPPTRDNVRILVHPDDHALVTQAAEQNEEKWRVIASRDISAGGCRVETEYSAADFTVEQRFAQAIEQIYETRFGSAAADASVSPEPDATPSGEVFQEAPEPVVMPVSQESVPEPPRALADEAQALVSPEAHIPAEELS